MARNETKSIVLDEKTQCYFITMNKLKEYLVIPLKMKDGVDDLLLNFIECAKAYLRRAVDDFDEKYNRDMDFARESDQWTLFYVAEMYQNRNIYSQGTEPSYILKNLMSSLQLY